MSDTKETKDTNAGYGNTGEYNRGYSNTGDNNFGCMNSGSCNSGYWNTGHRNRGDWNSGNRNSGSWNTGDYNSCDGDSGFFNSEVGTVRAFNRMTDLTRQQYRQHPAMQLLGSKALKVTEWVAAEVMTDAQKQNYPGWETNRGTMIWRPYKQAWAILWGELGEDERALVATLPNWDPAVFKTITGVDTVADGTVDRAAIQAEIEAIENTIKPALERLSQLKAKIQS